MFIQLLVNLLIVLSMSLPLSENVVISQVYGGGGNSGAVFRNDFVELYNRGNSTVNLSGWAIQYASPAGSSWQKTDLTGTIAPGQYFLIQQASGGSNGEPLPKADAAGTISMAATAGKVVLTNNNASIASGVVCPSGALIVDLVGYGGNANCFEGAGPAPAIGSSMAAVRADGGCKETDNNSSDFTSSTVKPRNSSSPASACGSSTDPSPLPPGAVVVSQIFAAGGNSGASFRNDFVELFNRSDAPVSLAGWSLQYATASGGSWQKVDLNASLAAGQYYLIQLASGGANGAVLPAADASGSISLSSSAGKIALVKNATSLNAFCPFGDEIVDSVGYGSGANCFEGSGPAPTPGGANALFRAGQGCSDGNDNAKNFSLSAPKPRNSKSPLNACAPSGPVEPPPALSVSSDGQPGSALFFPIYSSSAANPARENSRISITNLDASRQATVRLFFIDDGSAAVADAVICLSPHQTSTFLASDFDPNVTGYLAAVAVDSKTGCPIKFNFLIGDVYVRLGSGHAANLSAEAFSAVSDVPAICNETATTAEIKFDGVNYSAAPRVLVAEAIPSPMDGNSTLLVIDRIGGNLATGEGVIGRVSGFLHDDAEKPFGFDFAADRRQFRSELSNEFPRTLLRISSLIPTGRIGWMKFWPESDGGIIGTLINFNPKASTNSSAFNQGRNLHRLSLTTAASLTIPVFPPDC